MSSFTPLTGASLFQSMVEQYSAEAAVPAQTDVGSTLGAMFEASVLLALQVQQQVVYLFAVSRLGSSTGADVDSFVTPFGIARLGAGAASGQVTFTYPTPMPPGQSQTILVGSIVQTEGGTQFSVVADTSNPDYSPNAFGYVVQTGQTSTSATVQASQTGVIGNVQANTITLPFGGFPPIPGSPSITNPEAFTNGVSTETDTALKLRFAQYISGGGEGTINSIIAAVQAYPQTYGTLTVSLGDQWQSVQGSHGSWHLTSGVPGWFTLAVNVAGTGVGPPNALINGLQSYLLNNFRPAGVAYNVIPPTLVPVAPAGTVVVLAGYSTATVLANVQQAFTLFVNNIGMDPYGNSTTCSLMQAYVTLAQVPGVQEVRGLTLNGAASDISAPFGSQMVGGNTAGLTTSGFNT